MTNVPAVGISLFLFLLMAGVGCPEPRREVEVGFSVETVMNEWGDAPVSTVSLVVKDVNPPGLDFIKPVGSDYGCKVVKPADFDYKESLAEAYCYWAGGGTLFQAHETEKGNLEVRKYVVSEVPNVTAGTYSIEIVDPASVYTFEPNPGVFFVRME